MCVCACCPGCTPWPFSLISLYLPKSARPHDRPRQTSWVLVLFKVKGRGQGQGQISPYLHKPVCLNTHPWGTSKGLGSVQGQRSGSRSNFKGQGQISRSLPELFPLHTRPGRTSWVLGSAQHLHWEATSEQTDGDCDPDCSSRILYPYHQSPTMLYCRPSASVLGSAPCLH